MVQGFTSCKKDWLEVKSDKSLAVPSTLKDLRALLDNSNYINGESSVGQIALGEVGEISSDNYYLDNSTFQTLVSSPTSGWKTNVYSFAKDIYQGSVAETILEMWNIPYRRVYYANVVLDELKKIGPAAGEQVQWNNTKGIALFTRAYVFSQLMEVYSKPYNPATAATDLGIPLRLNSNLNEASYRENVQKCFERILSDLEEAVTLLDATTTIKTRPSKATAFALLSRVYLNLGNYEKALFYADECLKLDNRLLDFSTLAPATTFPIPNYNVEDLYTDVRTSVVLAVSRARMETALYDAYDANDLRKSIYFKRQTAGYYSFNGSYTGSVRLYFGIARDEVYLTRAECHARLNNVTAAMKDLNDLLRTRWRKNTNGTTMYQDLSAANPTAAMQIILKERQKELLFRGLRWADLRRLNREQLYQTTLKRVINGTTYELTPNSSRYVFPIPDDIIQITGMQQNER